MQNLSETIRPSADLRSRYSDISKLCRDQQTAVIITVNGRGDTVSLGYEKYQQLKARIELLEMLADSEEDVRNNRFSPIQDTFDALRNEITAGMS